VSRRLAREKALQMLFQIDVGRNSLEMAKLTLDESGLSGADREFAWQLVEGALRYQEELDGYIQRYAVKWDLERLAKVDKNVMRLALFEIKYRPDIPAHVSINEAIELVKIFGSDDSSRFINGILDSIYNEPAFLEGKQQS